MTYRIKSSNLLQVTLIVGASLLGMIDLIPHHDPERVSARELILRDGAHLRLGLYLVLGRVDHSDIAGRLVLGLVGTSVG